MARISCLKVDTLKLEQFNLNNEDPDCKYPYAPTSYVPSFVAKSNQCILFDYKKKGKFGSLYIKLTISASSTSGPDAPASDW